jgi:hypothetical protein
MSGALDPAGGPLAAQRKRSRGVPAGRVLIGSGIAAAVLLAALVGFRDTIYREMIEPTEPFQVYTPPPAPDYADAAAWAARPQSLLAGQAAPGTAPAAFRAADVFFVHPTTAYDGRVAGWNADQRDATARTRLESLVLPNHAAPFASAGPLWIPHYRQATLFAMIASREDTWDALDLAYSDVAKAFAAFLAARPEGAPYVLAGSGQGGLHVVRLLQEAVAPLPAARSGLVAAYVLDQPVPLDQLAPGGPLDWLALCTAPGRFGCLVTYAEVERGDTGGARLWQDRGLGWSAPGGYRRLGLRQLACVNPLTGGAGPSAPASANPGAVAATGLEPGTEPPLLPGESGAACANGLLLVDPDRQPALRHRRLDIGARYTTPGYNLFYQALADDAHGRVAAWTRTNR